MAVVSSVSTLGSLVPVQCPLCEAKEHLAERIVSGYQLVRCRKCSLVYMNPQLQSNDLARIYEEKKDPEEVISLYARLATESVISGYNHRMEYLESRLGRRGKLVDYACAAGYFLEVAQRRGWEAHGVDLGAWVRVATERRGVSNVHIGRIEDIAFPDGYFDIVYAAQVFEHLQDPRSVLKELRRILHRNGILYVDVPNYRTLPIMFGRDDFYLNAPPQHINYFVPRTFRRLLEDGGFRVEKLETEGGLKWENLIGRPIISEIADAYRQGGNAGEPIPARQEKVANAPARSWPSRVVRRLMYQRLKVGINLVAICSPV